MKPSGGWPICLLIFVLLGGSACAAANLSLWDLAAKKEVALDQAARRLAAADLVHVGETHNLASHHQAQLQVIKAVHATGKPCAVGLEMFQRSNQESLDRWIAGKIDENEFAARFRDNWGEDWPLYRDIFLYCRSQRIPMIGLNVPKEITSQVARRGFGSLTQEQVGMLPLVTCRVDPEYLELMRSVHGHSQGSGEAFTHFCEAQLVWDTAMAVYSLDYLKKNPKHTLVVLAGSVHAWKKGIPAQVQKESSETRQLILLPNTPRGFNKEHATAEDADYLVLGM
jgi:uncharacterized iron-regulated protein